MRARDLLKNIAVRAAVAMPIEPSFTALPCNRVFYRIDTLTSSLHEEFPFLLGTEEEISDADAAKFDGLFAWLVGQLRNFPNAAPDPDRRLVEMLTLASRLECDAELWGQIVEAVPSISAPLLEGIAKLFTKTHLDFRGFLKRRHYSPTQTSIVLNNVARKNWKSVEGTMKELENWLWLPLKFHSAAALYQYDRTRLESLVDLTDEFFEVAAYVIYAPIEESLAFAPRSRNWTFKFWAFHKSARHAATRGRSYPCEWEALLTEAVVSPEEWARWLAVLNEFPARYPQIQVALGNALASATDEALEAYIASISKFADLGRRYLAVALGAFRVKASLPVRQRLWIAAFKRWKEWDFGCEDQMRYLLEVAKSSFDYPVMGYLTECLSSEERAKMAAELETRAVALERDWHTDLFAAVSERFKLISTYQLLAHAEAVVAGSPEWLAGDELYKPTWENGTAYRSLKYYQDIGPRF